MLGTFRLVLALLVALSHINVKILGLNPGVVAVVCFYLISGYVMTGLLHDHYFNGRSEAALRGAGIRSRYDPARWRIVYFYFDRALRIFPHYLVVAGLTLIWYLAVGKPTAFLQHAPALRDLAANVSVVPLNYYMFNGTDLFTLVPPAWSLGAEIQFYLLIPLLLLWRLRTVAFLLALGVGAAAAWGIIDSEIFGYRLLPGVLVFFLLGSALYEGRKQIKRGALVVLAGTALSAIAAIVLLQFHHLMLPYNRETLLGLAIGLPLLHCLGRLPHSRIDNRLGDLSYGVFLNHFLIQWVLVGEPLGFAATLGYLTLSLLLSAAIQFLVERPVLHWRHRLRQKTVN